MITTVNVRNHMSADQINNDQRMGSSNVDVCRNGSKPAVVAKNAHVTHTRTAMMAVSAPTLTCQTSTSTATSKANQNCRRQLSTQKE